MALISPGIEVKVVDESQYASTAVGTVPMLVIATGQDKQDPTTGTTASGTLAVNAEKTYLIGSQRELVSTFGEPAFYQNTSGTALHGYELNEYGLMSAYSLLGVSNRAYIVRADIDTTELAGSAGRPSGSPANGTHWVNSTTTGWGIFQWNTATQRFDSKTVTVITDSDDIDSVTGLPKSHIGKAGDYAVDATNTNNLVYAKFTTIGWVSVGSSAWYGGLPTLTGTSTGNVVAIGDVVTINGVAVSMTGTTFTQAAQDINDAAIPGVTSNLGPSGSLQLFGDSTVPGGAITISATGTFLTDAGWTARTYYVPAIQISEHTNVPEWRSGDAQPRPIGSLWIKTTSSNNGASFSVSEYNTILENFVALNSPVYKDEASAIYDLDPIGGGLNIDEGTLIVLSQQTSLNSIAYKIMQRAAKGEVSITGSVANPTFTAGHQFTIEASGKNTTNTTTATITLSGTANTDFVADINGSSSLTYVTAEVSASGNVVIKHTLGGFMKLTDLSAGTAIADAGISLSTTGIREDIGTGEPVASGFRSLTYVIGATQPTSNPVNNRMWYQNITDEIDIMIHDGTTWKGYQNVTVDARGFDLSTTNPAGPFVSASAPLEQSDNTPLVYGDLWIDTSDLENFPVIKRYDLVDGTDTWVTIDNTDQTSSDGIVFADARYMGDSTSDVANAEVTSIADLLTSNYTDLDCPSDALYPRGTLLFNTRRSSYNVKQFKLNYFNSTDFPGQVLPTEKDAWVSIAGNKNDGSPYMGRKAVRQVIVEKMKSVIDTSAELREEQRNFNVIAAPGYPELLQNMIALNNDRRNTGFIVGDTPFRLAANSTDLQNWANNSALATDNGDDGLVSADTYMGIFYPHGITTDLDGNSIMVPASHMILRTMIRSDEASYPWFAPAGTRRGVVDNATGLGYLDTLTGEFISTGVRESLRDTLYENSINPVAFFPGNGILNYGNKTRTATASALDRINVARLVAYIRERLAVITKPFVFEPNDKLTRDEVKQVVEQLMNDLVAKRGLYDYLVVCDESNNTPDRIDRNELYIDIAIEPVKAVEYIYIPVRIQNTGSI